MLQPITSLETVRKILGWNPLHFYGLSDADLAPIDSGCNTLVKEYQYQDVGAVGRHELRSALIKAEEMLQKALGYAVGRRFVAAEVPWPENQDRRILGHWYGQSLTVPNEGYIGALGTEQRTAIDLAAAVVYTDKDGDTFDETFTVTVALPPEATDATKIAVFVPEADQVESRTADGETWRILPVKVSIAAGVATITGSSWLLVKPLLYEGFAARPTGLEAKNAANYLTDLSVYYVEPSADHGVAYYDFAPWPAWCCQIGGDPAAVRMANIRGSLEKPKYGIINPVISAYDSVNGTWSAAMFSGCRAPDRVLVNAYAGFPLEPNGEIARELQRVVVGLMVAEISGDMCGCTNANRQWGYWQTDVSRTSGPDQFAFKEKALDNIYGTKRGHTEAIAFVKQRYHTRSTSFG